jgi:hypothetical protein
MRVKLEEIGIGFEDFEQQADQFQRLAAGPSANLVGFSDGSLSGDGNKQWWLQLDSCCGGKWGDTGRWRAGCGGGGAALASDNTNVLLSSTRMEALGLAAGMSYARTTGLVRSTGILTTWV